VQTPSWPQLLEQLPAETAAEIRRILARYGPMVRARVAATLLGLSERQLEKLRMEGRSPSYLKLLGGKSADIRYPVRELERYIAAHLISGPDWPGETEAKR
jgi:hypothetical protein